MRESKTQYVPKGGMCAKCINNTQDCSGLDFESMYPISTYKEEKLIVVRCEYYENNNI